jgi:hypothetical protein
MRKKFHLIRVYPDNSGVEQAFQLLMRILKQPSLGQYVREIRYHGRPGPYGTGDLILRDKCFYFISSRLEGIPNPAFFESAHTLDLNNILEGFRVDEKEALINLSTENEEEESTAT